MGDTLCAVVLAAGRGRRLRPLTTVRPKPLCPVDNVPLIDHALARVEAVTSEIAVNVHFGREPLEQHLAGRPINVSVEDPEPLGTAGALGQLRPWIDGRGVAVVNADTWCPGSSLAAAYQTWDHQRARLLVVGEDRLRPTSRVAGALLPWAEVAVLDATPSGLYEASWGRLVEEGRLDVQRWDGPCVDCGTPASYLAANLAASGGASVVARDAVVEGIVERSVIWSGAQVCAGEHLVEAIRANQRITVLVR